jgi:hypothetical protein
LTFTDYLVEMIQMREPATEFGSHFIFIAALPKSASSQMWLFASAIQEPGERANPERTRGTLPSPFLPLTFDLLDNFPDGGVLKSHAPMCRDTDMFLRIVDCRYIVLLRHPADYIASLYCHGLRYGPDSFIDARALARFPERTIKLENLSWSGSIDPCVFDPDTPSERALNILIGDGPLLHGLQWMADWLAYRNDARSIVIRYEDLMTDFDATIEKLSQFLRQKPAGSYLLDYLTHVWAANPADMHSSQHYPRGWTGELGIWRQYFSAENVSRFNAVCDGFLKFYPRADSILHPYPDLMLLGDDISIRKTPIGTV